MAASYLTVSNCQIHGFFEAVYLGSGESGAGGGTISGVILDHCKMYNIGGVSDQHSDLIAPTMNGPLVVRYCEFWDWTSMIIFSFPYLSGQTNQYPIYMYGNVFHDANGGTDSFGSLNPVVLENSGGGGGYSATNSFGPVYFYHNTIYNAGTGYYPVNGFNGNQFADNLFIGAGSIYYSSTGNTGCWTNNLSNIGTFPQGSNIAATGINPLVSPGVGGNFNIVTNSGALYPLHAGVALTSVTDPTLGTINFGTDPTGNAFANPPSIGAYEVVAQQQAVANYNFTGLRNN